jgi:hypothetical protein
LAYANFYFYLYKNNKSKERKIPTKRVKEYEEYVEELVGFFACLTIYHFKIEKVFPNLTIIPRSLFIE